MYYNASCFQRYGRTMAELCQVCSNDCDLRRVRTTLYHESINI